ncbi:MAG: methyltransferase family protein [Anaerolineae bacterium]|jgi:protein-S-isoprenylcysteine O-methyltransferase Ste14
MRSHGTGFLFFIAGVSSVLAFPLNPLVLLKVIEPNDVELLRYMGWMFWLAGIVLVVLSYYHIYIRKAKTLVDGGIYAVVRHPMYLGWILSIFVATLFLYQHWVFLAIGIAGVASMYLIARQEELANIEKLGDDYKLYMREVPRMNLVSGVVRLLRRRRGK